MPRKRTYRKKAVNRRKPLAKKRWSKFKRRYRKRNVLEWPRPTTMYHRDIYETDLTALTFTSTEALKITCWLNDLYNCTDLGAT